MVGDVVDLDWSESIDAYVKGDVRNFDSFGNELIQDFLGEVEASGGCSSAAIFVREDSLVPFVVVQFFGDIGWKGYLADLTKF